MTASPQELSERVFNYPKVKDQDHGLELINERKGALRELSEMAYRPNRDERAWELLERGLYEINWSHQFFGFNLYERYLINASNEIRRSTSPSSSSRAR